MADSTRWCAECMAWGDHHTDRHAECAPDRPRYEGPGDWIPDGLIHGVLYGTRAGSEADLRENMEQLCALLGWTREDLKRAWEHAGHTRRSSMLRPGYLEPRF